MAVLYRVLSISLALLIGSVAMAWWGVGFGTIILIEFLKIVAYVIFHYAFLRRHQVGKSN